MNNIYRKKMSAIKYFFSQDGTDLRGEQFAKASGALSDPMNPPHETPSALADLMKAGNYVDRMGVHDDDVHPEVKQFLNAVGVYHAKLFGVKDSHVFSQENEQQRIPIQIIPKQTGGSFVGDVYASQFVENVLKVWNILPVIEKKFFDAFVNLVNKDDPTKTLDLSQWSDQLNQLQWRLNLKRHGDDKQVINELRQIKPVRFEMFIPEKLRPIYWDGYKTMTLSQPVGTPALGFSVNWGKVLAELLQPRAKPLTEEGLTDGVLYDMSVGEIIEFRDGKLVRKEDGKLMDVGIGDLPRDKCFTSQFEGDERKCVELMQHLADDRQDVDGMMEVLRGVPDSGFASAAADSVSKMDIRVARRILEKFGMQIISVMDNNSRQIQKFESLDAWLARIQNVVSEATKKSLLESKKLLQYLGLVIGFINSNPAILNSGVLESKVQQLVEDQPYLMKVGVRMLPQLPMVETNRPVDSVIKRVAEATKLSRLLYNQNPLGVQIAAMPRFLVGGGASNAPLLRSIINGLISDLSARGKKVRQRDVEQIEKHLTQLENLDKVLNTLSEQMRQYREWLDIIGDRKVEAVSDGSIRQSLDKYQTCASKYATYENGILKVAIKLSEECTK
jgi:hypothetical protein